MADYPTAHISASPEDFARTVLMPGDPLRSKFIAENFLDSAVLVNNVRGVQGYTGFYRGHRVSVMASGMGIPSMCIYSYELFNFFGVDNIIRVGSAGAMRKDIKVRDIVIAEGACTDSNYASQFGLAGTFAPIGSFEMLEAAVSECRRMGAAFHVGNVISSDYFYGDTPDLNDGWKKMGVMAVEMEAAGLYCNAARAGKNALAICTVSDHLLTGEALPAEERQTSFVQMIEAALNIAAALDK